MNPQAIIDFMRDGEFSLEHKDQLWQGIVEGDRLRQQLMRDVGRDGRILIGM